MKNKISKTQEPECFKENKAAAENNSGIRLHNRFHLEAWERLWDPDIASDLGLNTPPPVTANRRRWRRIRGGATGLDGRGQRAAGRGPARPGGSRGAVSRGRRPWGSRVQRPGSPGLRPQASGNGVRGQDGGRECTEVGRAGRRLARGAGSGAAGFLGGRPARAGPRLALEAARELGCKPPLPGAACWGSLARLLARLQRPARPRELAGEKQCHWWCCLGSRRGSKSPALEGRVESRFLEKPVFEVPVYVLSK